MLASGLSHQPQQQPLTASMQEQDAASNTMERTLELSRPLAFLDIQSTGLDPDSARIVKLSVLRIDPDGTEHVKSVTVNPWTPIPPGATQVHGISDLDVMDKPVFRAYARALADHLEGCDLAGFGIERFGLPLLLAEFERNDVDFVVEGRAVIDAMTVFHRLEPRNLRSAYTHFVGGKLPDTDDEAQEIWENIGVPKERIYRFGDEDNWWGPPIHGSEGPCGPCSELHYDFGSDRGCLKNDCAPNCENLMSTGEKCTRFVELRNLVFMQYYHHPDGTREKLPAPSIDTGMGLERATIVMQDVETMYETDIFASLIAQVCSISGHKYGKDLETDYAIRAIAEHTRSSTFLTADGVVPGNEGRGYVLRRVIRRAIRLARKLGLEESFMSPIAESVIVKMKATYPELYIH